MFFRSTSRSSRKPSLRRPASSHLNLEALEDRTMPSANLGFALDLGGVGLPSTNATHVATDNAGDVYVSGA